MSHTCTKLIYHCVFGTKDRRRSITDDLRPRLHRYVGGILERVRASLIAFGGTEDHIHLVIELRADMSVAEAMRLVKTNSSKWIHDTSTDQSRFGWQGGYAAFSASCSGVREVVGYVENQREHHRRRTFEEEYTVLLARHGLADGESLVGSSAAPDGAGLNGAKRSRG